VPKPIFGVNGSGLPCAQERYLGEY